MWNEQEHRSKRQAHIYREPNKYVLYSQRIGRPSSTIERALYETEWTQTLFFNKKSGPNWGLMGYTNKTFDLYKGSRKQVFVRRYVSYFDQSDNWIRLKPAETQPKWMVGKTHEEIEEANMFANVMWEE